ncbi:hypothetical protein [Simkania sp.]|uniref:hypothetical protein n=1 Tax=Simkania sp. TaxID=34094 RepID=UPI003B525D53
MKKTLIALFIGLFFSSSQLLANDWDLPIPQNLFFAKIEECFSSLPSTPYLRKGTGEAMINGVVDPILDDETFSLVFLEAEFRNQLVPTKGMVAVSFDKATQTCHARLLCLTDSDLFSPVLFFDIINGPELSLLCPEAVELVMQEEGLVFVHTDQEMSGDETRVQVWTFYNTSVSYDIQVFLHADGQGGTYFTLKRP